MEKTIPKLSAEESIRQFLLDLGVDITDPHMTETPDRVARAYRNELLSGYQVDLQSIFKTFEEPYESLVIVKEIPFYSLCAHHMLPFYGTASVAYRPKDRVVGLSKLGRVVECFSRRLQVQERLTKEVAVTLQEYLAPHGVVVFMEAEHMCMSMRGVRQPGAQTTTFYATGEFQRDQRQFELVMDKLFRK